MVIVGLGSTWSTKRNRYRRQWCRHVTWKFKKRVEHRPTRKKKIANGKYKYRGGITLSRYRPHYTHGTSICQPTCHVAPLTGVRVASCHSSAPRAPRAGQPWRCHVASTHAMSARRLGPLATSSPAGKYPLFAIFLVENTLKIHLKIK